MDLQITIAQQGATTGYAIVNIYDSTAPSVVIDSKYHALPISTTVALDFLNLEDMTYLVRIFLSSTTDYTQGTQIGSDFYAYPGNSNTATIHGDKWLIGGTDLNIGGVTYNDADLLNWKWSLERIGQGTLQPDIDYTQLSSGGLTLIDGSAFQQYEKYVIHYEPNITSTKISGGGGAKGALFSGFSLLTNDTTLSGTDMGKMFLLQGSSGNFTVTLPATNSVSDNVITCFMSTGGSHKMVIIDSGSTIIWLNESRSKVYLGQGEEIWIAKNGSNWYVVHSDGNFRSVGELLYGYILTELNCIQANGGIYSRSLYPRLWEWISNKLSSSSLCSESDWDNTDTYGYYTNHGKFTSGDGTTTFRVPLLYRKQTSNSSGTRMSGYGFLRGVEGTSQGGIAGLTQQDGVGDFYADIQGMYMHKSGSTTQNIIVLDSTSDNGGDGVAYAQNRSFSGKMKLSDGTYRANGETRPGSVGVYLLIRY